MSEYSVEASANVALDLAKKIRVLHVDDEPGLLKIAKQALEMEGPLQVDTAISTDEALAKLEQAKYDVIVSDYKMPGKDGLDLLRELREKGNTIPFIMFTGKGREEVAIRALNLGANQYINKVGETQTVYTELVHSITELARIKEAEEKQCESEEKFRDLFEKANDGFVFVDLYGKILDINQKAVEIAGKKKEDILGKSFTDLGLIKPDILNILTKRLKQHAMNVSTEPHEIEIAKENGEKRYVEISSKLIRKNNTPQGTLAVVRDVTERRKAEEALRESEERFSRLSAASFEGIGISQQGKIIDANDQLARMLGYEPGELIGRSILDCVATQSRDLVKENVQIGFQGPYEHLARRKDESVFPVDIRARTISYKGRTARVTVIRDATERTRLEKSLRENEQRYRELFETAYDAILVVDLKGNVNEVNNAILRYGYKKADVVGKNIIDLVPKRFRSVLVEDFSRTLQGKPTRNEIEIETPNGKILVEYSASVLKNEEKAAGVQVIIRGLNERKQFEKTLQENQLRFKGLFMGNPEAAAYLATDYRVLDINPRFEELFGYSLAEIKGRNINDVIVQKERLDEANVLDGKAAEGYVYFYTERIRKDGSVVPVAVSAAPIKSEGELTGYVAMYKDISELRNAEKRQETLNEKLQVVGQLTRHDVRNKLSIISGNVYLLKKELAGNDKALDKLTDVQVAVQQATRIFEFARTYESLGVEQLSYMNVEKTVNEAHALFSELKDVKLTNNCHGLTIMADSLLRQMFYNLIDNSIKHGKKTTAINIYYQENPNELKLYYEDNGVGIPLAQKKELFKEGFSTGGSTGYGLYLIKKIAEVYGWTIQETGEPHEGAQFTITIPKTSQRRKENYVITNAL
jgi:PAS domain S-box-containing protein